MSTMLSLKNELTETDGEFEVEYEILMPDNFFDANGLRSDIANGLANVETQLQDIQAKIDKCNEEIDRLTSHADKLDIALSVTSGIVTGLIDSFIVGEWDFANAKAISNQKINDKVMQLAKKHGYNGDRLEGAISKLEETFHLPGDGAYKTGNYGVSGHTHRLDDLCHHPTLVGLIACLIAQFTGTVKYVNSNSEIFNVPIEVNEYGNFVGKNIFTKFLCGIINWFITCAKTMANAKGHLLSDAATPAGVPGSFLSTLKELSALPCFKNSNFGEMLRKAYQNGIGPGKSRVDLGVFNNLFNGASSKFDLRTEMAIGHELKRQAIPVIINEALVRGIYFVRRFAEEMKQKKDILQLDWKKVLPFRNRTIVRMLTVATGTFTAVDLADAAIRSAIKGGVANPAVFLGNMVLRVNFVGLGRFAIAIITDAWMGIKKEKYRNERIALMNEQLMLYNAKTYYLQANLFDKQIDMFDAQSKVWIAAEDTAVLLSQVCVMFNNTAAQIGKEFTEQQSNMQKISSYAQSIEEMNPGLIDSLDFD